MGYPKDKVRLDVWECRKKITLNLSAIRTARETEISTQIGEFRVFEKMAKHYWLTTKNTFPVNRARGCRP